MAASAICVCPTTSSSSSAFSFLSSPLSAPAAGLFSSSVAAFSRRPLYPHRPRRLFISCSVTQEKKATQETADEVTRKFGLEAGLWKIFTSEGKDSEGESSKKGTQAKELLARYGGAYLATSISLSAISFGLCYVLINAGVDVASLLQKVGIQTNETGEKVGTFALAYAAHKAASPIRFPPTVALTPIVASWFGKKMPEAKEEDEMS